VTAPLAGMLATGPIEGTPIRTPLKGLVLAAAAGLSLAAWTFVVTAVLPLLWAAGAPVDVVAGVGAVARSIVLGALSLVPLGASVAGISLLDALQALGAPASAAAAAVFVFRASTAWLSVALGGAALLALRDRPDEHAHVHGHDHFDAIDACYDAWLPLHYREHLVGRKTAPMLARLPTLGAAPRGLDIGCGRGWYAARMREAGASIVGLDTSTRQLVAAREHLGVATPLVQGTALTLPFASCVAAYIVAASADDSLCVIVTLKPRSPHSMAM